MSFGNPFSRFTDYFLRHGFIAAVRRTGLAIKRTLFSRRMVIFYCDLGTQSAAPLTVPTSLKLQRTASRSGLSQQDLEAMTSFWNPKLASHRIRERFERGATLWLIRSGEKLAGYGWTLQGATIEPYYFPLGLGDVHLFDFHVFSQYRGQGINPLLVKLILSNLATECRGRAFIETAEWNDAQLSSLQKTPFQVLGIGSSVTILGRRFVRWADAATANPCSKREEHRDKTTFVARLRD